MRADFIAQKLCIMTEIFALLFMNLCYNKTRFLLHIGLFALKTEISRPNRGEKLLIAAD